MGFPILKVEWQFNGAINLIVYFQNFFKTYNRENKPFSPTDIWQIIDYILTYRKQGTFSLEGFGIIINII